MRQIFLALALLVFASPAFSANELIMFNSPYCEWCALWEEEVGVTYGKTDEGRSAPIRRVDIDDERPSDLKKLKPVMFTPTFVLINNGQEIGRITGYPGEAFFWGLLDELIGKMEASVHGCKNRNLMAAAETSPTLTIKTC